MGDIKLDLKNFKYHSSTDKSTTLEHSKLGHKLTLYHNVLSPKNGEMLKALAQSQAQEKPKMAEGGETPHYDNYTAPTPVNPSSGDIGANSTVKTTPEQDKARHAASDASDAAYRKEYPSKPEPREDNSGYKTYNKGGEVCYACGGKVYNYADGGDVPEQDAKSAVDKAINLTINTGGQQPQQASTPMQDQSNQPASPGNAPPALAASGNTSQPQAKSQDDQEQPQAQQQAPDQDVVQPQPQVQAQSAPEAPIAALPPDVAAQPKEYQDAYQAYKQAHMKEFAEQNAAFAQDLVDGHIQPKTYQSLFQDKSTLGKIGTIFGMLLSGAGSGLSHQPNALLAMMDKQIQNDLQAQEKSKDNAQNFLRINQQRLMNDANVKILNTQQKAEAFALAQSQMLQSTYHSMVDKVNQMPEGPQKEAAKANLGMIYNQIGAKINNINDNAAGASAYYNTVFGPQAGNSSEQQLQRRTQALKSGAFGPAGQVIGQDIEQKHFPGLKGNASVPLSGNDREYLQAGTNFQHQMDKFIDWTKNHSGDLSPSDIKEGRAKAAELQGAYRQATHGGVYKEGEQNFISKLIDEDPTKFFNSIRVLPSLRAISETNKDKINSYSKNLGFDGYESSNQPKEISKFDPRTGKTIYYDAVTKKPLRAE